MRRSQRQQLVQIQSTEEGPPIQLGSVSIGVNVGSVPTTDSCIYLPCQINENKFCSALIDSGAQTSCVIGEDLAQTLTNCPKLPLPRPRRCYGFSGAYSTVTHYVHVKITVGGRHEENIPAFIVPKLRKEVILGIPWLRHHEPKISWGSSLVLFSAERCLKSCLRPNHCQPLQIQGGPDPVSCHAIPKLTESPESKIQLNAVKTKEDIEKALLTKPPPDLSKLPEYLKNHHRLFSEEKANELPPHRPGVDHDIILTEGAQPPCSRMYGMSQDELKVLQKYIKDNLAKGYIRPSSSSAASPGLFQKKPSGGLRFCVDYRKLNDVTIKDRTAMPLTKETFERLSKAKYFTKVDVVAAYNKIRIAKGKEWMTAFRTRYGLYEYLVMPFGMSNAPSTFNRYVTSVLGLEILDSYATHWSDDILIYSETLEEHQRHVKEVFRRLEEAGLFLDIEKCQFGVSKVDFLGFILEAGKGISLSPKKIEAVRNWKTPTSVKEVRGFLGFVNYFRRFIEGFSKIAAPLTSLTNKQSTFSWSTQAEEAFQRLKELTTADPVLALFDPTKPCHVFTDASDYASGAILKQPDDRGAQKPVAYFSAKHIDAELRYHAHDKELLAIIKALKEWRAELQGAEHPIKIHSDHKNLGYFMTAQTLNYRQARWQEFLSRFNFRICYVPGKSNGAADALSRRAQDQDDRADSPVVLIPPESIEILLEEEPTTIPEQIKAAYANAPDTDLARQISFALENNQRKHSTVTLADCSLKDNLVYHQNRLWIPNDQDLRRRIIEEHHCGPLLGHTGVSETYRKVNSEYYWPLSIQDIKRFIRNCHTCQRTKSSRKTAGQLLPLPVPQQRWQDITMDYITDLPSANKDSLCPGATSILVIVDRLSKEKHLVPCKSMNTGYLARVFIRDVIRLHGLPQSIVTDRGSQFLSKPWTEACRILGIKQSPTSAFHPQSDGQSERSNQDIERQLRGLVNNSQDDWVDWLPVVEFAMNSASCSSTKMTPFFANKGFEPRCTIKSTKPPPATSPQSVDAPLAAVLKDLQSQLEVSRQLMSDSANRGRTTHDNYQPGDLVWLSTSNLRAKRPCAKLSEKWIGPFPVEKIINARAYRLTLPSWTRVHPVFHCSLLRPATSDPLQGQTQTNDQPGPVADEEWEVEEIEDLVRRGRGWRYIVKWVGWGREWNTEEPLEHVEDTEALDRFESRTGKLHPKTARRPRS